MLEVRDCPIETTMSLIGGKWKILILKNLLVLGNKRFGELKRGIPGISSKVLTNQLNEMIADHLIQKTVFAEVPPHTEYDLTPVGMSLQPILTSMFLWGTNFKELLANGELEDFKQEDQVV